MGNCLAGDGCPFSHDPSHLISNVSINDGDAQGTAPATSQAAYLDNASESFPPLQPMAAAAGDQWTHPYYAKYPHVAVAGSKAPLQSFQLGTGRRNGGASRPQSRPTSRHQNRDWNASAPSVDDPDAFPSLGAVSAKGSGKKHGKRGAQNARDGNSSKESLPASLADVVRMTPSPASSNKGKLLNKTSKEVAKSRENSAAAQSIPAPKNIPWLETGSRANQQYIKYRTEAIRHGTVRNKFLQR